MESPRRLDHVEGLLVGVSAGGVEIEVGERGEGLHMQLAAITPDRTVAS